MYVYAPYTTKLALHPTVMTELLKAQAAPVKRGAQQTDHEVWQPSWCGRYSLPNS